MSTAAVPKLGQRVVIKGKEAEYGEGTIRYIGTLEGDTTGKWIGIELDNALGKHDGVVKGKRYFQTAKDKHGVFTKYGQTIPVPGQSASVAKKASSSASLTSQIPKKAPSKVPAAKPASSTSKPSSSSNSATNSNVASAATSQTPSPHNELEDIPEAPLDDESDQPSTKSSATTSVTPAAYEGSISPSPSTHLPNNPIVPTSTTDIELLEKVALLAQNSSDLKLRIATLESQLNTTSSEYSDYKQSSEGQVAHLEQTIADLKLQLSNLDSQMKSTSSEYSDFKRSVEEKKQTDLASETSHHLELESKISLMIELESLQTQNQRQIGQLKQEKEELSISKSKLEAELLQLTEKHSQDLSHKDAAIAKLDSENSSLQANAIRLESQFASLKGSNDSTIFSQIETNSNLAAENAILKNEKQKLDIIIETLRTDMATQKNSSDQNIENLKGEILALKNSCENAEAQIAAIQAELDKQGTTYQQQLASISTEHAKEINAKQLEINLIASSKDQLAQKVSTLESQTATLRQSRSEHEATTTGHIQNLTTEISQLKSSNADLKSQLDKAQQSTITLESKVTELQAGAASSKGELDEAIKELQQENQSLKLDNQQLQLKYTDLESKAASSKQELGETIKHLKQENITLKSDNQQLHSQCTELEMRLSDAKEESDVAQRRLLAENSKLTENIAKLDEHVTILREASEELIQLKQMGSAQEIKDQEHKAAMKELKSKLDGTLASLEEQQQKIRSLESQLQSANKIYTEKMETKLHNATSALKAELDRLQAETSEKIETLSSDLEMATIDKEIAEEQRDTTLRELEQLKLQIEMQAPASAQTQIDTPQSSASGDSHSSAEYEQLSLQHERLKEALVKLKDMAVQEKQQHEHAKRELENLQLRVVPALEERVLKLSEQQVDYEEQIENLQANIDDGADLQAKYTQLFEAKLDLEEDNRRLKVALTELESLRDISEELEEAQSTTESRLRADLYAKQVEVLDRDGIIKNKESELASKNQDIERLQNFLSEQREQTAKLQAIIKSKKAKVFTDPESNEADGNGIDDKNVDDDEGNAKYKSTVRTLKDRESELQIILSKQAARAAVQLFNDKLKELERVQALEQLHLLQLFIPESSIRADMEVMKSMLVAKRLATKSNLLVSHLIQQFHLEQFERAASNQESITTGTTEELAYIIWLLAEIITSIGFYSSKFVYSVQCADFDTYIRIGKIHSELTTHEKKLDQLIKLTLAEELASTIQLNEWQVIADRIIHLTKKRSNDLATPANVFVSVTSSMLTFAARSLQYEYLLCKHHMSKLSQEQQDLASPAVDVLSITLVKYLVEGSRKLRRASENRTVLTFSDTAMPTKLQDCLNVILLLRSIFTNWHKELAKTEDFTAFRFAESAQRLVEENQATFAQMLQRLPAAAEGSSLSKHYDSMVTSIIKYLFTLDEEIAKGVYDEATNAESKKAVAIFTTDGTSTPIAQLQSRGNTLIEQMVRSSDLQNEVAALNNQVREKDAALILKGKEIEDLDWKIRKQEHRLVNLERSEQEAKNELSSQQKGYASRLLEVETANRELTERIEQLQTEATQQKELMESEKLKSQQAEEKLKAAIAKHRDTISFEYASSQLATLKATVKHLSQRKLQNYKHGNNNELKSLPPLDMAFMKDKNENTSASQKASHLIESASRFSTHPRVIDLGDIKSNPLQQQEAIKFKETTLKAELLTSANEILQALAEAQNDIFRTHFGTFPSNSFVSSVEQERFSSPPTAFLTLADPSASGKSGQSVLVTPSLLQSLHETMLNS